MNRIATRETGGNARQAQTGFTRHASPAPCACRAPELCMRSITILAKPLTLQQTQA